MTHEEKKYATMLALSESLKRQMADKPVSKVSVSELVRDCHINRKTFYYHFADVSALLQWTLEAEAVGIVRQFDLYEDCADAIRYVMTYIEQNPHILNCVQDSVGREGLKTFFAVDFYDLLLTLIRGAEAQLRLQVPGQFKEFLVILYTEGIAGMLIEWIKVHEIAGKEQTVKNLALYLETALPEVLKKACES